MSPNDIIHLFFRYKKGEIHKYSDTYLTNALYYLPGHLHVVMKKNKSFFALLEDMPSHIFHYYTDYLNVLVTDQQFLQIMKVLCKKREQEPQHHVTHSLDEYLITCTEKEKIWHHRHIGGNSFVVILPKKAQNNRYNHNVLLYIEEGKIKSLELLSDFLIKKGKDDTYEKSKEVFLHMVKEFEEKNKLKLLFT